MGIQGNQLSQADSIDLFCPFCSYNLRGIESVKCPECGKDVDRASLSRSRIPWENRKQIGRLKAYWATVFAVLIHPGRFGRHAATPVSYRDARLFRWITVTMVSLPVVLGILLPRWIEGMPDALPRIDEPLSSFLELSVIFSYADNSLAQCADFPAVAGRSRESLSVFGVILLILATGVAGWFFRPRYLATVHQNRAFAVSQYACAPLALAPFAATLCVLLLPLGDDTHSTQDWLFILTGTEVVPMKTVAIPLLLSPIALVLLFWWIDGGMLLVYSTRCSGMRVICYACLWPVLIAFVAGYSLIVLPWVYGFVKIAIISLKGG